MSALPFPESEIPLSVRRSALMLHGVSAEDQTWLLGRISEPQRTQIAALLQELRALGIPAEEGAQARQMTVKRSPKAETGPRELVMQASGVRLADALKDEPDMLAARLIQAGPWEWEDAFIALLAPGRRTQVQELLADRAVPPKLADAVVNAVAQKLAVGSAPIQHKRERSISWRRWFGRWAARGVNGVPR